MPTSTTHVIATILGVGDTTGLPAPYDPLDHLDGVTADPTRRIIIMGNIEDTVTPFYLGERFYQGLRGLGHRAELREAKPVHRAITI